MSMVSEIPLRLKMSPELASKLQTYLNHNGLTADVYLSNLLAAQFGDCEPTALPVSKDWVRAGAQVAGVPEKIFLSRRRIQPLALIRQIAMTLMFKETNSTAEVIGQAFGGRGCSTVYYADRIVDVARQDRSNWGRQVRDYEAKIRKAYQSIQEAHKGSAGAAV